MKRKYLFEGPQVINNLDKAIEIINTQWSSPDDYWYVKILQRKKDNDNVVDDEGRSIFVNGSAWVDGDKDDNRIGYVVVKGNTKEEAINSLLNATVTIFDSWVDFVGNKHISSNDGNIGSIIEVCRAFNARAYMSSYKRSFDSFRNREPKKSGMMPGAILGLAGKTDPSSRERVFDHLTNHQRIGSNPYYLIDCDDESENVQTQILDFLKNDYNIEPLQSYKTHNGVHFLVDLSKAIRKKDNMPVKNTTVMNEFAGEINYYLKTLYGNETKVRKGDKRGQENPAELEHDRPIILFSEVGIEGRNVEHPEWQKYRNYPMGEFRTAPDSDVKPAKQRQKKVKASNKITFMLPISKDGKANGYFKCDGSSKDLVINALKERFPKMPIDRIISLAGNDKFYVTESLNTRDIIKGVIMEFIEKINYGIL